jgi:hypothetical protein
VLVRRLGMSDNLSHLPCELDSRTSVDIPTIAHAA